MLQFIRSKAGSFFVKLLFVLLIGSFGIWGVGDFLRQSPRDTTLISVGSDTIEADRVQAAYRQTLEQMRRRFGSSLDPEQARALGLIDRTVDDLVGQTLFDQEAKRLNVAVGDAQIAASIAAIPGVASGGKVDRIKFAELLRQIGMSEQQFVVAQRGDLRREMVGATAQETPTAPKVLVDTLYDLRNEHRVADYVFLPTSAVKDLPAPDDAALHTYYDKNHESFTAPEYRGFTALFLQVADVAAGVKIADDDLKAAYEKQKDTFHKPETRHVLQMLLPDEATADQAEQALAGGKDFLDVAKTIAKQDASTVDLGSVSKDDLPTEIASVAFDAKNGDVAKPVHSALGWTVVKIAGIEPEATKSFDEVKPQLETELRNDAERDALDKLADNVQNALSGGVDLNAIAQQFNLKPVTVASVDDGAKDPAGNILSTLPIPAAAVMKTVFETANGQASGLEEIKDGSGYYVVKVDTVTAPALRPFDEVKDKVVAGWQAEQRTAKVAADGKALADSVKPDLTLAKAAVAKKLELRTSKPFTRTNDRRDAPLPPDVVAALFKGDVGTVASGATPDGFYVAQLKEIQPAATGTDPNATAQLKKQLDQEMGSEMVDEFELALRDRYPVDVRHAAIDQLLGGGPSQ